MPSSFERLVFEIIATDKDASAAFDRFRRTVDKTSDAVDRNSRTTDKNASTWAQLSKTAGANVIPALVGTGVALGGVATSAVAAGAGVAAFAGLTIPSVLAVNAAMTGPGGLAAGWATLDNRQRVAATGIQALSVRYHDLAAAMEPRAFQVFNQGLSLANSLLGPAGKLATAAGTGISSFLQDFSAHSGIQQFITFLSGQAAPAIALLGSDITHIAHAVFQLLQSFGGAGLLELRALTGVFTALDVSITFLSQHAPGLTSVALSIGGIAFALSKIGVLGSVLKLTGLSSIGAQLTGFAAATTGATLAEKGLVAQTAILDAITPFGWAVLGAAALGGLVWWLSRFKGAAHDTIRTLEDQNKAVGFNTFGYYKAANAIGAANQAQEQYRTTTMNLHTGLVTGTKAIGDITGATGEYTDAQKRLVAEGDNQLTFLQGLEDKYHLTEAGARSLAIHAGVLASDVNKGGQSMKDATARADAYANSNLRAQTPVSQLAKDIADYSNKTLTATDRTKALSAALQQFFNPLVTADQAVIQMKNDQVALAAALAASGGKTGLLTQKQRDARGAFETYITDVATAAQKAFEATGRTSDYTRIINNALPALERAAGHNKTLREEIRRLIETEAGLRDEHVSLSVRARGTWALSGQSLPGGWPRGVGAARGMLVTGGIPGQDSVPIMAMPGEVVVPTPLVAAGAVDHLRGRLPGFAAGGMVSGSYDRTGVNSPAGLNTWLQRENRATARAIIRDEILMMHRAASGGSGSAIVNYAMQFLGRPYVWGGTTPAGWDCSGFTSYVYHHFGIPAPRTSQQQQIWARPSGDVPGALVFFYGTGGTASHVGLSMGRGRMINASNPARGTLIDGTGGNSGFGTPPGGFGRGGASIGSGGGGGSAVELGRAMAGARYFWNGPEWQSLFSLWQRESGWNRFARNPSSGAYGIPQALPPGKMGPAANPPQSSAAAQIGWGLDYIARRYGDPITAMGHERRFGWYDRGGYLPQGLSLALNTTGRPEPVGAAAGGSSVVINGPIHIHMPHGANGSDVVKTLQKFNRQNGPIRLNVRPYP